MVNLAKFIPGMRQGVRTKIRMPAYDKEALRYTLSKSFPQLPGKTMRAPSHRVKDYIRDMKGLGYDVSQTPYYALTLQARRAYTLLGGSAGAGLAGAGVYGVSNLLTKQSSDVSKAWGERYMEKNAIVGLAIGGLSRAGLGLTGFAGKAALRGAGKAGMQALRLPGLRRYAPQLQRAGGATYHTLARNYGRMRSLPQAITRGIDAYSVPNTRAGKVMEYGMTGLSLAPFFTSAYIPAITSSISAAPSTGRIM